MAAVIVSGRMRVPGDKSISHRAVLLSVLSKGKSRIRGVLRSADVESTAGALRVLGANIPELSDDFDITGDGLRGLSTPLMPVDCGNSGTSARLLTGVASAYPYATRLVGDESLSRRPMRRLTRGLTAMGARFEYDGKDGLPLTVYGAKLKSIDFTSDVSSAQVKSAILLAGLVGGVKVSVTEPAASRDHTERMLRARGVKIDVKGNTVELPVVDQLGPMDVDVPGDPSSAAFFAAAATLALEGDLVIERVSANPRRTAFFDALKRMRGNVVFEDRVQEGGDWVANIVVQPHDLRGITIGAAEVPSLIDEIPMLACLAARAEGETVITGAGELRVKESDRIHAIVTNLRAVGVQAEELEDGMRITGSRRPLRGEIVTYGDHRIAMAFGVLSLIPRCDIRIDDRDCVAVSYPTFWSDLDRVVKR